MIEKFKSYLLDNELTDNTVASYILHVRGYMKWFEDSKGIRLTKLHRENLKDYISYLKNIKKEKPRTINAKISALIKLNEFLVETAAQSETVITKKDNLKIQQQYASLAKLDVKDIEKFRQYLLDTEKSKRNHCIITLMAYSGLRISEALNIRMSDFNLTTRELIIKGKGNKTRTVFISDKVNNAIKAWLQERNNNDHDYLFYSNRNQILNRTVVNKIFKHYSNHFGVQLTPHDLRHFYCSYAIQKGLSIHEVANQAGHSNIHTTMIYTNPSKNDILGKINQM